MENLREIILSKLREYERVKVISHTDCDGICSAILFVKLLKKLGKDFLVLFSSPEEAKRGKIRNLATFKLNVVLDIPVIEFGLRGIKNELIIIDHHEISKKKVEKPNILVFHPILLGIEEYCPVSRFLYLIFQEELKEFDYLACIGCIGDGGGKYWKKFIARTLKKYGLKIGKDENLYDNKFGYLSLIVGSGRIYRGVSGAREIFFELVKAKNFQDFEERCKKFRGWYEKVERRLKELEKEFQRRSEYYKDIELRVFDLRNEKYNLGSALSTKLSYKYPNLTIMIYNERKRVNVNLRRGDGKINLCELVESSLRNLDGTGGGHRNAAGATVKKEHFEIFKRNFIENLRRIYQNVS